MNAVFAEAESVRTTQIALSHFAALIVGAEDGLPDRPEQVVILTAMHGDVKMYRSPLLQFHNCDMQEL